MRVRQGVSRRGRLPVRGLGHWLLHLGSATSAPCWRWNGTAWQKVAVPAGSILHTTAGLGGRHASGLLPGAEPGHQTRSPMVRRLAGTNTVGTSRVSSRTPITIALATSATATVGSRVRAPAAGHDQPGGGDHASGDAEPAQHALAQANQSGLLAAPGAQEYVVVNAERRQEHEDLQRQLCGDAVVAEPVPPQQAGQPEPCAEAHRGGRDQHQGRDDRPQQREITTKITASSGITTRSSHVAAGGGGRDGGIRTRGLLLPNQLHPVAKRSRTSPDVALKCGNAIRTSPDVAW